MVVRRAVEGDEVELAMIHEVGGVVGEIVPLAGGERTATVAAVEASEVLAIARDDFWRLLHEYPEIAEELLAETVRRSEETELIELMAERFSLNDRSAIAALQAAVQWVRLMPGEVLFREGDESDSVSLVIRGALEVTQWNSEEQVASVLGHIGRGEMVGELGLLGSARRMATVTALRASVLARIDAAGFHALVENSPSLMLDVGLAMMTRGGGVRARGRESVVLTVVVCNRFDAPVLVDRMTRALANLGSVECLSPGRVERLLDSDGIAAAAPGQVGDLRLGRLLNEAELGVDHLLLDASRSQGYWADRCLAAADRVLVVVPPDPTPGEIANLQMILGSCPPRLHRTLAVYQDGSRTAPTGTARLMDRFGATDVVHLGPGGHDMRKLVRTAVGKATGLVLGGGGARGFAHLGVYRAIRDLGIEVDVFGGTSMGSILAAIMADGVAAGEIVGFVEERFENLLDYTIPMVSLIKGGRIARALRAAFGDRDIEDLWYPFTCISTDLTSSRTHPHRRGLLVEALRASTSIPGVMPPVPYGDHLLVDGGVLNNLPVDLIRQVTPAGNVIAVDVAPIRGPGAHRDFGLSMSGWEALGRRLGGKKDHAPRITAVLMRSMIVASQRERDQQIADGLADVYLDLDLRGVSMLDFGDVAGVAHRGYEAAKPRLEAWLNSSDFRGSRPPSVG